jgi:serine/threonine protein phosphatase PrpC
MQDMLTARGKFHSYVSKDGKTLYDDFWAVFDGHGGREAANFASSHLHRYISEELDAMKMESVTTKDRVDAIHRGFQKCQKQMSVWCSAVSLETVFISNLFK